MALRVRHHSKSRDQGKEASLIYTVSVHEERKPPPRFIAKQELVKCFWHESEGCSHCDGSEYRPRMRCAGCGELAGKPSQGGKALMELRTRQGRNQPFYCLDCHQELGRGLTGLEGMGLS